MEPHQLSLFSPMARTVEGEDFEVRAQQIADWFVQEMEQEGIDRAAQQQVLMRLQVRTLVDNYLAKIPAGQRWQFVVQLIDAIQEIEPHLKGF